jgi:CrcB protein
VTSAGSPRRIWRSPGAAFYLWIAVGSALGGAARLLCGEVSALLLGASFPWGILIVNVLGSFAIGYYFALAGPGGRLHLRPALNLSVMTGLCGGYTTFSAFSLDTLHLLGDGRVLTASANVALSLVLCLLAVWLGYALAARLATRAHE